MDGSLPPPDDGWTPERDAALLARWRNPGLTFRQALVEIDALAEHWCLPLEVVTARLGRLVDGDIRSALNDGGGAA